MVDFLKVETEGLELEVLLGIEDVSIRKLAIDAGKPNPDGEVPLEAIINLLTARGYDVRVMDRIVFARLPE